MVWAICVEGHPMNICVKRFENSASPFGGSRMKKKWPQTIHSSGGHLVQPSEMIWAIYIEGHPKNISAILFENSASSLGEELVWGMCWPQPIYNSGNHLVPLSGTVWAILVVGHPMNISVKLIENPATVWEGEVVWWISLPKSIYSSGGHPVQSNRTVWAILVQDHPKHILVKIILKSRKPFRRSRLEHLSTQFYV